MTSHSPAFFAGLLAVLLALPAAVPAQQAAPAPSAAAAIDGYRDTPLLPGGKWHVHDPDRPQPAVVAPGTGSTPDAPGKPPSDAVVLFDGKDDLSAWRAADGQPTGWTVRDGTMVAGHGDLFSRQEFGDVQVHVEFATPAPPHGHGQERGNSGVFLQARYEIQVLDSYASPTYPDGQSGAVYGQQPPEVNAARPPGEWQSYDIVFTVARYGADGSLQTPACVTVFYNGVLVQNHVALLGPTVHAALAKPTPEPATGPLKLQDHGKAVRYRNVWVRPLKAAEN